MTLVPLTPGHRFDSDEAVMRHALALAELGRGRVEPNPMVGAVLVDDDRMLIADGYHQVYGGPHAEAEALAKVDGRAEGATLFVTLEPCAHHGKQPPCADAVVASGVKRVVCAMGDPFAEVAGRGFDRIRDAGIAVEVGLLEAEARRFNAAFLTRVTQGRPYVIAKYAMTLDGKMAASSGHSMWISGDVSRADVHRTRGRMDAIVVGAGTVSADDPRLTARPAGPRQPIRVVFDSRGSSLTSESYLVQTAREIPVRLYHTSGIDPVLREPLEAAGVTSVELPSDDRGRASIEAALADLAGQGCTNLMLEGGATLLGQFRDDDLIDEYHVFIAPKIIGKGLSPMSGAVGGLSEIPEVAQVEFVGIEASGADVVLRAVVPRPWLVPAM